MVVTIVGGAIATLRPIVPRLRSAPRHFTAGVVFAAIAGEVILDVLHRQAPARVASDFVLGVAVMFVIQRLTERGEASAGGAGLPWGLLAAAGVDALLDGLVIGIGSTAGVTIGILVTIARSLKVLCLNPLLRRLNS